MNSGILYSFLKMTAWRMDMPQMFGGFHAAALIAAVLPAVSAAVITSRRIDKRNISKVLAVTGWVLVILELYKQLFLFHIVNEGAFDWWFFPFQLCSVPMYLCIFLPLVKDRARNAFLTFMSGYTLISAAAALIFPEDFLRPYVSLTLHGFVWHGILLFISLLVILTGAAGSSFKEIAGAAVLFAILSAAAVCINVGAESVMPGIRAAHPAVAHSWAAMFYMNPYHISPQPVVSAIQKTAGIPAGLVLYAIVTACAGSLACRFANRHQSGIPISSRKR